MSVGIGVGGGGGGVAEGVTGVDEGVELGVSVGTSVEVLVGQGVSVAVGVGENVALGNEVRLGKAASLRGVAVAVAVTSGWFMASHKVRLEPKAVKAIITQTPPDKMTIRAKSQIDFFLFKMAASFQTGRSKSARPNCPNWSKIEIWQSLLNKNRMSRGYEIKPLYYKRGA